MTKTREVAGKLRFLYHSLQNGETEEKRAGIYAAETLLLDAGKSRLVALIWDESDALDNLKRIRTEIREELDR